MSFKEQLKEDLEQILFNADEFADIVTINNDKQIKAIFVNKKEKDDNFAMSEPYLLIQNKDLALVNVEDIVLFDNKEYYITEIEYTDTYTSKLFLSLSNRN